MQRINLITSKIDLTIGETAKVSKEIQKRCNLPSRLITATAGITCANCVFTEADWECDVVLPLLCSSSQRKDKVSVIFIPAP
jgi:hypothetical protein